VLRLLAREIREGRRTAEETVHEAVQRIGDAHPLNAIVSMRTEAAVAEARITDEAIERHLPVGPMAGIPFLVKDIEDVEGLPTTFGSRLYASARPAARDGLIVSRLKALGAIVVGKTNTPELAIEGYTANSLFGATLNPWAPAWSPGGSSGGSAAALAAGLAPLVTATDVGGSVRIPASLCGLVGLKPTLGVIGRDPSLAAPELNSHGLLGITVADVRYQLQALAGFTVGDPGTAALSHGFHRAPRWRIFSSETLSAEIALSQEVSSLFREVVSIVDKTIAPVEWINPERIVKQYRRDDLMTILGAEMAGELGGQTIEAGAHLLDPKTLNFLRAGLHRSLDEYLAARRRRLGYIRDVDVLLAGEGLLLTPTLTVAGWDPEGRMPGGSESGIPSSAYNTGLLNLTGHPTLSLPGGRHSSGLPFGFQVVAPRFRDALVLEFGSAWARSRPWPSAAPGYQPFGKHRPAKASNRENALIDL